MVVVVVVMDAMVKLVVIVEAIVGIEMIIIDSGSSNNI